jgi:hypothetical protein
MPTAGECETGLLARDLRVRIVANGGENYVRTYSSLDY